MRAPVHLAAGDDIDAGKLLVEHRGLACPVLRVRHGGHRKLPDGDKPVERLVPIRHAVGANHGRGEFRVFHSVHALPCGVRGAFRPTCKPYAGDLCWSKLRTKAPWLHLIVGVMTAAEPPVQPDFELPHDHIPLLEGPSWRAPLPG